MTLFPFSFSESKAPPAPGGKPAPVGPPLPPGSKPSAPDGGAETPNSKDAQVNTETIAEMIFGGVESSASLKQQLEELKTRSSFVENGAAVPDVEKTKRKNGGVAWVSVSKDAQVNTETIAETTNTKEMWCCRCVVA